MSWNWTHCLHDISYGLASTSNQKSCLKKKEKIKNEKTKTLHLSQTVVGKTKKTFAVYCLSRAAYIGLEKRMNFIIRQAVVRNEKEETPRCGDSSHHGHQRRVQLACRENVILWPENAVSQLAKCTLTIQTTDKWPLLWGFGRFWSTTGRRGGW